MRRTAKSASEILQHGRIDSVLCSVLCTEFFVSAVGGRGDKQWVLERSPMVFDGGAPLLCYQYALGHVSGLDFSTRP